MRGAARAQARRHRGGRYRRLLAAFRAHRKELIDPKLAEFGGRIANPAGDSLLIEFASVVDAIRCTLDVQRAMAARNGEVAAERRIELRVGIHLGDVVAEGDEMMGDGVNAADRTKNRSAAVRQF